MRANTVETFWAKVDKTVGHGPNGDCWVWTAGKGRRGYGKTTIQDRTVSTHRYIWTETNGPIPAEMCVCHKCDNPPCVRPDHLFLGTVRENSHDMHAKGRGRRGAAINTAVLNDAKVLAIRRMHQSGIFDTQRQIADLFGISETIVSQIVTGRTWRHLLQSDYSAPTRGGAGKANPRDEPDFIGVCGGQTAHHEAVLLDDLRRLAD